MLLDEEATEMCCFIPGMSGPIDADEFGSQREETLRDAVPGTEKPGFSEPGCCISQTDKRLCVARLMWRLSQSRNLWIKQFQTFCIKVHESQISALISTD